MSSIADHFDLSIDRIIDDYRVPATNTIRVGTVSALIHKFYYDLTIEKPLNTNMWITLGSIVRAFSYHREPNLVVAISHVFRYLQTWGLPEIPLSIDDHSIRQAHLTIYRMYLTTLASKKAEVGHPDHVIATAGGSSAPQNEAEKSQFQRSCEAVAMKVAEKYTKESTTIKHIPDQYFKNRAQEVIEAANTKFETTKFSSEDWHRLGALIACHDLAPTVAKVVYGQAVFDAIKLRNLEFDTCDRKELWQRLTTSEELSVRDNKEQS